MFDGLFYISYSYRNSEDEYITNLLVYSSNSGKMFNASNIINDFDGIPFNKKIYFNNNELIFGIQANEILEENKKNFSPEFIKSFKKLQPLTENDNPIYAFVKLKEF